MNNKLKQALAKMLPDYVSIVTAYNNELYWNHGAVNHTGSDKVLDTELLHLCWLVEETLTNTQKQKYGELLQDSLNEAVVGYVPDYNRNLRGLANIAHATWQQRVIALAKVKGIEI
jgi:hypothetical protein